MRQFGRHLVLAAALLALAVPGAIAQLPAIGFPLTATVDSAHVVTLAWMAPAGVNVTRYDVMRAAIQGTVSNDDSLRFKFVDSVKNSTTYKDRPADSAVAFVYFVIARTPTGPMSSVVATVPWLMIPVGPDIMLVAKINQISMGPLVRVDLTWSVRPGLTVSKFRVFRGTWKNETTPPDPNSYRLIDSVESAFQTSDNISTNDVPGYSYIVHGVRPGSEPYRSNVAHLLIKGTNAPFGLSAIVKDSGRVLLSWFPVHDSLAVSKYYVRRMAAEAANSMTAPSVIDSVQPPAHAYVDRPPVGDLGGSFIYSVVAQLTSGSKVTSTSAFAYFAPRIPSESFPLTAFVRHPDTVVMKWEAPLNTNVLKYYVYGVFSTELGMAPVNSSQKIIDSTTNRSYVFRAPSGATTGVVGVGAMIAGGRIIPSNGVALLFVAPPPEPPRIAGEVLDSGKVRINITRPSTLVGAMAFLYRVPVDTSGMLTLMAWTLVDSTATSTFIDRPPQTFAAYVYAVRIKYGRSYLESNPFTAILRGRIDLKAYPDHDGYIRLSWTVMASSHPFEFIVFRQVLRDSALTVAPNGGTVADTVKGFEWKDQPRESGVTGFAYRVAIAGPSAIPPSEWRVVRWNRPVAPFTLSAKPESKGGVALTWNMPFPAQPLAFLVLRAPLPRTNILFDTLTFVRIDSVAGSRREYVDHPSVPASGLVAYKVEAVQATGRVGSNPVSVYIFIPPPPVDAIRFVSEPVRTAVVGSPYGYQPAIVSSDSTAQFRWGLLYAPQGMTIDTSTGSISWLPIQRSISKVLIGCASTRGGKAIQEFTVTVSGLSGSVSGVVRDTIGQPLSRVIVKLYRKDATLPFEYSRTTDSTGSFVFHQVEVGSYKAFASDARGEFIPQWWQNKTTSHEADPVVVAETTMTPGVDFRLRSRTSAVQPVWVSGVVMDTAQRPVVGAVVSFMRADVMLNGAAGGVESGSVTREMVETAVAASVQSPSTYIGSYTVITGDSGKYRLQIHAGSYVAGAYAPGFRRVFYQNTTDMLSATILKVQNDVSGINFTLPPIPSVALGGISGTVSDTSGLNGVMARVVAFRMSNDLFRLDAYQADTDPSGQFTVANLPPGEYVLLALPLGRYVPSFYAAGGSTFRWREASRLTVNGVMVSGITIKVKPIPVIVSGFTYVQGTVQTTSTGGSAYPLRTMAAGVNGSLVYATTTDGSVVGYSLTDPMGAYSITGLSPQTLSVTTDKVGYASPVPQTVSPTYDASGNAVPATVTLNVTSSTTEVEKLAEVTPSSYMLGQNYPNPFNPSTAFRISLPTSERVVIGVYNILGQKVATLVDGVLPSGNHLIRWDGRTDGRVPAATGMYFYTMRTGSFQETKRMILLK